MSGAWCLSSAGATGCLTEYDQTGGARWLTHSCTSVKTPVNRWQESLRTPSSNLMEQAVRGYYSSFSLPDQTSFDRDLRESIRTAWKSDLCYWKMTGMNQYGELCTIINWFWPSFLDIPWKDSLKSCFSYLWKQRRVLSIYFSLGSIGKKTSVDE